MFCNQCEQTSKGAGCTVVGVCGKNSEVAVLQDLLTFSLRRLAIYARAAHQAGLITTELNYFITETLFSTLTNVNFDASDFISWLEKAEKKIELLKEKLMPLGVEVVLPASMESFVLAKEMPQMLEQGQDLAGLEKLSGDPDLNSLQQLLLYGVRGIAAYAHHAAILGQEDQSVYDFIYEALADLGSEKDMNEWLTLLMKCGEINLRAMELLDAGNTGSFGHPAPTPVALGTKAGKCILVSGHDLRDLKILLEQTDGKGINIYTHGEMLPAHGYPELKKYKHLVGHYGTAWQNQKKEFAAFPGVILMTTNCIQEPQIAYAQNIFTTGPVGWPGVAHVENKDFSVVINRALELPGFEYDSDKGMVLAGFAHSAVLGVAGAIVEAVKNGAIKHFLLVGGCDGARVGRSYYSELVDKAPNDTIILTLGCGKFRFFDYQLGDIQGIPRLIDLGQCNDAYSAVQIAVALAKAFDCEVNDLPLSLVLSWYEQKAVSILLSLLYLGIKNIRLGPSLPAFVSPGVLQFLVDNFGIKPISSAEEDLRAILAG
ncbi:hydroxylamine reductase [Syntrophomonas wolfei]|uniref:hydroxylamine reductase n=1 Tax=Syntrophomonas wolfei TaxID=863 RepID=UPI00077427D6|nr:hydroxylamine reductase [Syntrophomonas wolfei]